MKKSLLCLALFAGFTGAASARSGIVGADAGNIGTGQGPDKFWHRRSTVSLFAKSGELRVGLVTAAPTPGGI